MTENAQTENAQTENAQTGSGLTAERADLLQTLALHRRFLRYAARDLTDEQARLRSTVSALSVGGVIKHVSSVEARWARFITDGPSALSSGSDLDGQRRHAESFVMTADETLAGIMDDYEVAAARTDDLVRSLPDLDATQPLPDAPWFPPGARWSVRRVLLHVLAETSQHAGHADIIREAIDGAKTMG